MLEDDREQITRWLDALYRDQAVVSQIDAVIRAETFDLPAAMMEIVSTLPSGRYSRTRLADQLNSAIIGRGLSRQLGTHD
jgi:hypothetical protein